MDISFISVNDSFNFLEVQYADDDLFVTRAAAYQIDASVDETSLTNS